MDFTEILTDLEIQKIEQFNSDIVMSDAVKKVLFAVINEMGVVKKGKKVKPLYNGAFGLVSRREDLSNEQIGADLRAYYHGVGLLESGFSDLSKIKVKKEEGTPEENPAI